MEFESILMDLKEYTWDKIHSKKWTQVEIFWRDIHSFCSLGLAGIYFLKNKLSECIHVLDIGIMIGAVKFKKYLHTFVQYCHDILINNLTLNKQLHKYKLKTLKFVNTNESIDSKDDNEWICRINIPTINPKSTLITMDYNEFDMEQFIVKYFVKEEPIKIFNMISDWPALKKWNNLDYFVNKCGFRTIPIEIGRVYTDDSWTQKLMNMHEYISQYVLTKNNNKNIGYLAQHELFEQIKSPSLINDFSIPDICHIGKNDFNTTGSINAWFGPKGTITPIHYDPKHNLLSQIIGYKYICLFHPNVWDKYLYPYPKDHLLHNTSTMDINIFDLIHSNTITNEHKRQLTIKYPQFFQLINHENSSSKFYEIILKPGDVLYIPPKWGHFVTSLSVSFSLSFWFD